MKMSLSRLQPLARQVDVLVQGDGQYALTQLLAPVEFSYGGSGFGRGYDPSELLGDHGAAVLAEVRYAPDLNPWGALTSSQLYLSYDLGAVWAIDTNNRPAKQTGASVAAGWRFSFWRSNAFFDLQVAKPLTRGVAAYSTEDGNDPRGFLSDSFRY